MHHINSREPKQQPHFASLTYSIVWLSKSCLIFAPSRSIGSSRRCVSTCLAKNTNITPTFGRGHLILLRCQITIKFFALPLTHWQKS